MVHVHQSSGVRFEGPMVCKTRTPYDFGKTNSFTDLTWSTSNPRGMEKQNGLTNKN
jgi:hypothetical protein